MANQQQQVWRKAEEAPIAALDTGDIFVPLKKIRDQYYARAQRTLARATDKETGEPVDPNWAWVIDDMRNCGDRVNLLIPKENVDVIPSAETKQEDSQSASEDVSGPQERSDNSTSETIGYQSASEGLESNQETSTTGCGEDRAQSEVS